MNEDVAYKYYVIKFETPPKKCLDTYLCVPKSWTNEAKEDPNDAKTDFGRVRVWFPFDSPLNTKQNLNKYKNVDVKFEKQHTYMARVEYKTDYFKDAMAWISLMEKLKKNESNNEQDAPVNKNTKEKATTEGDQASKGEEPPSSFDNCSDKQNVLADKSDNAVITIDGDSKDDEPVTSSSSAYNVLDDADVQKQDNIVDCLKKCIQNLLKNIDKERKEEFRFEFDEIRIVRACDNNVVDTIRKLKININDINCDDIEIEGLPPAGQKDVTVVTEQEKASKAPEASASPLEVPGIGISQSQGITPDRSFGSTHLIPASQPEDVFPSTGQSSHFKPPTKQNTPHKSACTEAFIEIATNVKSLSQKSTEADIKSSSKYVTYLQQLMSIRLDYPDVTIKPTSSSTQSKRSSTQISVPPADCSSRTNYECNPQYILPNVTVCNPDEINKRAISQNMLAPSIGSAMKSNSRTSPHSSSTPMIVSSNVTCQPTDRSRSKRPSPQAWITPATIDYKATTNVGSIQQNLCPVTDSICSPNDKIRRVTKPNTCSPMVTHSSSVQCLRQADNWSTSKRSAAQTSVSSAVICSTATTHSRSLPQNSCPIVDLDYRPDEINNSDSSRNSSSLGFGLKINASTSRQNSSTPIVISPHVTFQPTSRSSSKQFSPQTSFSPAVISSIAANVRLAPKSCPIVDYVHNEHEKNKRVSQNTSGPAGNGSALNSRSSPQILSTQKVCFSRPNEWLAAKNSSTSVMTDSRTDVRISDPNSSLFAAIASDNNFYVRLSQQISSTSVVTQANSNHSFNSHSGNTPGDQTSSRKRVHSSTTQEPFGQNEYEQDKKPDRPRNSPLPNDCSETKVIILD